MSSREKIIAAITSNKPDPVPLPSIDIRQVTDYNDLTAKFISTLESIGGKVFQLETLQQLELKISNERNNGNRILNTISESEKGEVQGNQSAAFLEPVYKAYIKATKGVAENGAVWISESQMINRSLPFICQHLVILLQKGNIVSTMHNAYQQINAFEEGFGVFIAGPSKTADIEQSLVIGAHGARSLSLYLLN